MSFFPASVDLNSPTAAVFDLVEIDTTEGTFRYMIGIDGVFTDVNGVEWLGSTLASMSSIDVPIGGVAPTASISLTYYQDPNEPDLINQIKAQGIDYVKGREVRFFVQHVNSPDGFHAPEIAPIKWDTRISRGISVTADGAHLRQINLAMETWAEDRRSARRIIYNTEGHANLIGSANPSLEFMPTVYDPTEKLFG